MPLTKLENLEAISLILIVSINHLLLNMPQTIINNCGSASILNIIYVTLLICILSYFVFFRFFKRFPSHDIIDISKYLGGDLLKNIVGILCIIYLISLSSIFLRNFAEGLKLVYFYKFPIHYVLLFFLFTAGLANFFGPKAILKSNLIIVPIVLIGLFIVFIFTVPYYEFERSFPIFGYGLKETFLTGSSNIFAFNGLFFLLFIRPLITKNKNLKKVIYTSIIITGIFLIMAISTILLAFPSILSIQEISPIYFVIRNIQFGSFFQRPEALFILTWIMGVMSYLNCVLFLVLKIFKKLTKIKDVKNMTFPFICISAFVALIPKNMAQLRLGEDVLYKYGSLILIFGICGIILILANIKSVQKGESHE